MASVTGVPQHVPADVTNNRSAGETEPLLGGPGDATQAEGVSIFKNLFLGTGFIAQFGIIIFFIVVWVAVFNNPLMLFSGHPLAQSLGILILVQSVLSLQPTHTVGQKRAGRWVHASLNLAAFLILLAGVVIIETNKFMNNGAHFHSVHGYLGVITSIVLLLQYLVGFTMWATPALYGGEANAKAIWKYHRSSGYVILVLLLVTAASASKTDFNESTLKIPLWSLILLSVLILIGILPRIRLSKLGYQRNAA